LTGALLGVALLVEVLRSRSETIRSLFHRAFGSMLLDREIKGPTAATYLLLSAFLVSMFYTREVAVLCLLFLTVGDTLAFFVGSRFGRVRYPNGKSLEGSLAFVISCVLVSLLVPGVPLWIKLSGIAVGAFLEAFQKHIDDNLLLPLGSGLGMEIILRLTT
jgi:dolichol kinase